MKFSKTFWPALAAVVAGTVVVWILVAAFIGMIASSIGSSSSVVVGRGSVLHIDMGGNIVDSPDNKAGIFDLGRMRVTESNTLLEVLDAVEYAAADPNIEGIYINFTGDGELAGGNAHLEELRAAITRFKESGKFVVAYNDAYSHGGYYLASVADKVYLNPRGVFDWRGLSANITFFKGLLDKLDAEAEIIRHGEFKAAVEPYITDKMSDANRLQTTELVNSLWGVMINDIAASRGVATSHAIAAEALDRYAEELAVVTAEDARSLGFVDDLIYNDQMLDILDELAAGAGVPSLVPLADYIDATKFASKRFSHNRVAVIYADGQILDGESYPGVVGGATVAEQLRAAREDDGIKAVVFRINSPGGSALASEVMWREAQLLREKKPLVVSMGAYAASGGYYISAPADVILADRTTLTGSIGVFGMMINIENTLKNKLGITFDGVKTNPSADLGYRPRGLSGTERMWLQRQVEDSYKTFAGHVAEGRNMTFEQVDAIGGGRVWLGANAFRIGLTDGWGGLYDAIVLAVDRAGIAGDFAVEEITTPAEPFMALVRAMFGAKASTPVVGTESLARELDALQRTLSQQGVQALMPYILEFE